MSLHRLTPRPTRTGKADVQTTIKEMVMGTMDDGQYVVARFTDHHGKTHILRLRPQYALEVSAGLAEMAALLSGQQQ